MFDDLQYQRLLALRMNLQNEIRGIKGKYKPTAYMQIKREFNLHGSRKNVLEQFSRIVEEFYVS